MSRNLMLSFTAAAAIVGCLQPIAATAQGSAPAKPSTYAGCVTALPQASEMLVLSTPESCYLLSGAVSPAMAGHQVQLSAILIPQQGTQPITLQVKSVLGTKAACSQTCTLRPPGTRGLGPKDKPGREGGTPGVTNSPGSPQP